MVYEYRGPIAIHAALTTKGIGIAVQLYGNVYVSTDAFGAVLAIGILVDVIPTLDADVSLHERAVGDWVAGRFAWRISNVQRLQPVIPMRGRQGLWRPTLDQIERMERAL